MDEDITVEAVEFVASLTHHNILILQLRPHILLATIAVQLHGRLIVCEETMNGLPAIVLDKLI